MKDFLKSQYRNFLPFSFRVKIRKIKYTYDLKKLRKRIIGYYSKMPSGNITNEQLEVLEFIKNNQVCNFPYTFTFGYDAEKIKVFKDENINLNYVFLDSKRLYFKRSWTEDYIKNYYNLLLIEQNERSPHRYLTDDFFVENNSVIVDVGVAEGNFSLGQIEKVKKIYLFETDYEWIEALNATFEPWKEKVEIINKYASNNNNGHNISLDSFLINKEKLDFLKIDVDGAEAEVLEGCEKLLNDGTSLKIALCTYHKQNDGTTFSKLLEDNGFNVSFSNGYMIFINHGLDLKAPYLRRGLIRATK